MNHRIKREIQKIATNPPFGISCNFKEDSVNSLEACVAGMPGTPFEKGVFELELNLTDKYPFQPPQIKFITPVYHPNVDNAGRICMDLLKMPPNGAWRPTITIEGLLIAVQSLLTNPNPDDPLVPDIAEEFKYNRQVFEEKARNETEKYAIQNKTSHLDTFNISKKVTDVADIREEKTTKLNFSRSDNLADSKNEDNEKKRLCQKRRLPIDNDENLENQPKRL